MPPEEKQEITTLVLVVASKTKEVVKAHDLMFSSDAIDALNLKVHQIVQAACERTKGNNRKTVRACDF